MIARIETASFFEQERREKDKVQSRCRLGRSDYWVAPIKKSVSKKLETDLYI